MSKSITRGYLLNKPFKLFKMNRIFKFLLVFTVLCGCSQVQHQKEEGKEEGKELEQAFRNPPESARPWTYWFWINGNISKEGITADLESFKRVGIGGVLWMEVSGPWWAPDGDIEPLSKEWHDAYQWAISECNRLDLKFDATLDFGYGSGGTHITPEQSMQKLVWSEVEVKGGESIDMVLKRANIKKPTDAWLRPEAKINKEYLQKVLQSDSYKDVAVVAIPLPAAQEERNYRIAGIDIKSGLGEFSEGRKTKQLPIPKLLPGAVTPIGHIIDLTAKMDKQGHLKWDAPAGQWVIIRYGHVPNYKWTRPCPAAAVGLECDRLSKIGIETHFDGFLKKIIEGAGSSAGGALAYAHIDSWEAGYQNWTSSFPDEFKKRRGYDLKLWLPVLTGRVVGNPDLSDRFLWDIRQTVNEMIQENYVLRFKELLSDHNMKLSIEAYGNLCIDNLSYAGLSDMPCSEFWAQGDGQFPVVTYDRRNKVMASAAHTYGKPIVGAEAFTGSRGWRDHPFLLKSMGDNAFCNGVNRLIFHCSAHQPYENMIPGITHRRWGEHFNRFNTWWEYSKPWIDYLSRCQYMLQQGRFVADVCYWFGEGAPLSVNDMTLDIPKGYNFDFCPSKLVLQMKVSNGQIVLPSGMGYRYLLLPDNDRMTLPLARKIKELADAGAQIIAQKRITGSPGLTNYLQQDKEIKEIATELWDSKKIIVGKNLEEVFNQDKLKPDFEGEDLPYIHRRIENADVYFISNQKNEQRNIACTFRVSGKYPELWDPETGDIRKLPEFTKQGDRISIPLHFDPMQSWFMVFREGRSSVNMDNEKKNYVSSIPLRKITGEWEVGFDPKWGGPDAPVKFEKLSDWSKHSDPKIHYYSGTATYKKTIEFTTSEVSGNKGQLMLDLGSVDIMARVKLNGKLCGTVWKPPYCVDISAAAKSGVNKLEIEVVNLWINRMIGDEQLPEDSNWKDFETLLEWPEWFKEGKPRPSGRYTFTSCKHYKKDTPLVSSGLLGPVILKLKPFSAAVIKFKD